MHIEKLPSGSYRITQTENGHRYRITVDHRPTNAEALRLISEKVRHSPAATQNITLSEACAVYLSERANVLSPSTKRSYNIILRNLGTLGGLRVHQITGKDLQIFVNDLASRRSPKTCANYSGFIMSVLKDNGQILPSPRLPQRKKTIAYIPTADDIKRLSEATRGIKEEVAISLACMGLRRSEICALTVEDLSPENVLTISKAKIRDEHNQWVIRMTKTTDSTRQIRIPDALADQIRQQGYIFEGFPNDINDALHQIQDEAGIPRFSLHKLRHFFASYLHAKGYSPKQIQALGGWRTPHIMETVYTHAMEMEQAKQKASEDIGSLFSQ